MLKHLCLEHEIIVNYRGIVTVIVFAVWAIGLKLNLMVLTLLNKML